MSYSLEVSPRPSAPPLKFHAAWALFAYVILYALFFSPVLFSGRVLAPDDNFLQNLPAFSAPRTLWTASLFSGYPIAADPQSAFWYPVSFLMNKATGSFNLYVLTAYILASWFTYGYVYTVTKSRFAAFLGGICYGMSGFFMAHLRHVNMLQAALWLPLILLSLEKLRANPSAGNSGQARIFRNWRLSRISGRWLGVMSFGIGLCGLAGHPQIFLYTVVFVIVYALVNGGEATCGRFRYYALCAAGLVLGILMAAVLLIPGHELALLSQRARFSLESVKQFSLPLWQIPTFIFPYLFGGSPHSFYGLAYPGPGFEEKVFYLGLLPLLLIFIALSRAEGQEKSLVRFWLGASIIIFLLILRPASGFISHVPFYNHFRAQARQAFLLSFGASVLAGFGIKTLTDMNQTRRLKIFRQSAFWIGALTIVCLIGAQLALMKAQRLPASSPLVRLVPGIAQLLPSLSFLPWRNPATGIPLLILGLGILSLYSWCKFPGRVQSAFVLLMLILDLSSFGWFCEWRFLSPRKTEILKPAAILTYESRCSARRERLGPLEGKYEFNGPVEPNLSRLWNLPSVSGYNPLILKRYGDLLGMNVEGDWSAETLRRENSSLDLLCLRYLFVSTRTLREHPEVAAYLADASRWRPAGSVLKTLVFENRAVFPRAWITPNVLLLKPDEILEAIKTGRLPDGSAFLPKQTALIEGPLDFRDGSSRESRVAVRSLPPTQVNLNVENDSPAFLILSDIDYPGWRAWVDQTPAPIYRADYVLRGVRLPPGKHDVRFQFVPVTVYAGLSLTIGSLLISLGLLCGGLIPQCGIKRAN